jgi:putative Mg2+ transporter-C (MgtC) family protein
LTTAATIWVAAAIGVCCGLGYWYVTLIAMALILTVLMLGGPIERLTARRLARGEDDESAEI